jgi:hypothetical protein
MADVFMPRMDSHLSELKDISSCTDQAAELVPLSLSTALVQHQSVARNALYNDGDDESPPVLYHAGGDDDEPVCIFLESQREF